MSNNDKKTGSALRAGALAEQARGLITGRVSIDSLVKVIKLLGPKKIKKKK